MTFSISESPGILNWALDGLDQAPGGAAISISHEPVRDAIQTFKDDSNPVSRMGPHHGRPAPILSKIERGDLLCAFHGWWREEMGDDVRLLGGRWFDALACAPPARGSQQLYTHGTRYFDRRSSSTTGGLKFWQRQSADAAQRGHGSRGSASSIDFVNKSWTANDDG